MTIVPNPKHLSVLQSVERDGRGRAGLESVRIVRVQRVYFDPPDLDGRMPRISKWDR